MTVAVELARRYPNLRIIFSGGTNALIFGEEAEAAFAVRQLEALGVPHERITAEEQSRNTVENAVFSRLIANPQPGQRWLLLTSAFHMPRAIAVFRAAGFPVEAYPVDWRTTGPIDRGQAVSLRQRRSAANRRRRARVDRPAALSAHGQNRRIVSRSLTPVYGPRCG